MKENFEIEKELKFKNNIAEVISISLEEKHEVNEGVLKGNFIVSGEYKIHEISLNKERFNFKIPYEHKIGSDIDSDTVDLEIINFTYDVDGETLYITINYDINGDRKDILLFDDEENLEDFLKSREVEIIMDESIKTIDEVLEKKNDGSEELLQDINDQTLEEKVIRDLDDIIEYNKKVNSQAEINEIEQVEIRENKNSDVRNIEDSKQELLNSVNVTDDNYITYKIHIVKQEDTLESILMKYSISLDELKEYNEFNNLQLGDKIIIPIINEE